MRVMLRLVVLAAAVLAGKWVYETFLSPVRPISDFEPEVPSRAPEVPAITFRSVAAPSAIS